MDEFNKNLNEQPDENTPLSESAQGSVQPGEVYENVQGERNAQNEAAPATKSGENKTEAVPEPKAPASTANFANPENPARPAEPEIAAGPQPGNGYVPPYNPYTAPAQEQPYRPQPPIHGQNAQPGNGPVFNASGEYRYVPPYTQNYGNPNPGGAYQQPPQYRPPVTVQPAADKAKKKDKKERKTFSAGAVALIVVACILLSFGAGMAGALIVTNSRLSSEDGNALVVYKSPESDSDDDDAPSVSENDLSVSDICAKVSESVVEIDTEFKNTYGFYQYVSDGAGSGVIISKDGYVITNNHVIFNSSSNKVADSITVRLSNGTEYSAQLVGRDSDADIALLKVEADDLSPAVVGDSSKLKVGETVVAVGNPLGELGGTVTCGIISATNREISVDSNKMNLIQMDAAINPGNSGGGMFNMKGELVGIVNAKSSGTDIDGLGFAIPVNDAISVVEELQTHGYVTGKTHIGVSLVDVTDTYTAYYYFRSQQTGVYIAQVEEGFNSSVLKYGDRIIAIDGNEVSSSEDVKNAVKQHSVGDEMTFSISRDGKFLDVTVTCYEYVPDDGVTFTE
ncbi:MAG: trypsin-like peptidase domain-containing protein [Clostridia bacterium]|nr:trypsin-like peptidase domain-containing protein [Clostridia bacterium]